MSEWKVAVDASSVGLHLAAIQKTESDVFHAIEQLPVAYRAGIYTMMNDHAIAVTELFRFLARGQEEHDGSLR